MLLDVVRKLRPLYGSKIDFLWLEYQTADVERKQEIEVLLTFLAARRFGIGVEERMILDAPPPDVIGQGEFTMGYVTYPGIMPYPFCVARNELLRHMFVLGPTGSGKSTLLLHLLLQLQRAGLPFMIFDFKRNYRCLLHAAGSEQLVVFTVGRNTAPLFINALTPPRGVDFEEWSGALSDIISTSYLLMQGARNVLKEALLQAYRAQGKDATLAHAHVLLTSELAQTRSGSRRYGWLESSTRSLEELTKGKFGEALNAISSLTVEVLLTAPVVFELHGFGEDQKRFFCLFWLQAVLLLRKNSSAPRETLQHLLIFDEAHNIFPRERQGEISIPARLAREVREYGEAIVSATQQADVSESLIANSGFKFILRCDYPKDVQFASQLLQIETKWLPKLPLGHAIARLPVRFYAPFQFTFDALPIKNDHVTDAELHEHWLRHPLVVDVTPRPPPLPVSEREEQLLRDVNTYPISTITERYERVGWNYKTGNVTKDRLIEKQLARFDPVTTPTGWVKILSLTDAGRDHLTQAGVDVSRSRHGGVEHEYWKTIVKRKLETLGYIVDEEHPIGNGKTVDLHATRDNNVIWVEIETGRSDIEANIEKCTPLEGRKVFIFTDARRRDEYAPRLARLQDCSLPTTAELDQLT